ncbi:hypothetical protein RHMOL_Rhmol03G0009600 [Rhododendron molle]|uniref:Uncharacterized protein n=1 Tax=Rhododendron molle TaxID=49168 RepID=A0ACC0PAE2_RHOML|nr:hypothetical protein RHMOL_Rhmol03G0009600 [Rhododendron molle]
MSPTQLDGKGTYPSPLRINKVSHLIKKPTSPPSSAFSSSSSSAASAPKPPHRQPVIIYTHSPKVIHTHPRDFKALVQKLTGQSRSDFESDHPPSPPKQEPPPTTEPCKNRGRVAAVASDDTDSSSMVTDEKCSCMTTVGRNVQIKSCFPPPPTTAFYDPPPIIPCFSDMNIPFFPITKF